MLQIRPGSAKAQVDCPPRALTSSNAQEQMAYLSALGMQTSLLSMAVAADNLR